MIDDERQVGAAEKCNHAIGIGRIERIGKSNVRDSRAGEDFGFTKLGAANPNGAALDLPLRNQRALMRLRCEGASRIPRWFAASCILAMLRRTLARSIRIAGVRRDSTVTLNSAQPRITESWTSWSVPSSVFCGARFAFLGAGAAQHAFEAVVGFVAGVLVNHFTRRHRVEYQLAGERRRERRRVLDGPAVVDGPARPCATGAR